MPVEEIMTIISNVGFPIAACMVMFWYVNKERESHREEVKELTGVITSLKETIEKNTSLMERVLDKLS